MILISFLSIFFAFVNPVKPSDAITGEWISPKRDIKIRISRSPQGTYHGVIIWLKQGSKHQQASQDIKNPNPTLRKRQLVGIKILDGFNYNPKAMRWDSGKIYHPKYGKFFKGRLSLMGQDMLEIRGYWGVFKDSGIWKRL